MTFGMSQSHYQLGFCACTVYRMQAETMASLEGWGWLFVFFLLSNKATLVSFVLVFWSLIVIEMFALSRRVTCHIIKGIWASITMRLTGLWWFGKIVLIFVITRNKNILIHTSLFFSIFNVAFILHCCLPAAASLAF